jgi:hypothetical protein
MGRVLRWSFPRLLDERVPRPPRLDRPNKGAPSSRRRRRRRRSAFLLTNPPTHPHSTYRTLECASICARRSASAEERSTTPHRARLLAPDRLLEEEAAARVMTSGVVAPRMMEVATRTKAEFLFFLSPPAPCVGPGRAAPAAPQSLSSYEKLAGGAQGQQQQQHSGGVGVSAPVMCAPLPDGRRRGTWLVRAGGLTSTFAAARGGTVPPVWLARSSGR